jgi:hypothetical protein
MTLSEFTEVAPVLTNAIANVAGVDASRVRITGVSEKDARRRRRRLLGSGLQVDYSIRAPNEGPGVVSPTDVAASLTPIKLQTEMRKSEELAGVAETLVVTPVTVDRESEAQAAVKFSMVLQLTASQFAEVGPAVSEAVASVAGVDASRVSVIGFTELAYARRRLLGIAVEVDYLIQTPDVGPSGVSTTTVVASLTSSNMQSEMGQRTDLQSIADTVVVMSVVVVGSTATTTTPPPPSPPPPTPTPDSETEMPLVLYGVVGGASLLFIASAVVCCVCLYRLEENVHVTNDVENRQGARSSVQPHLPASVNMFSQSPLGYFDMQSQALVLYEHTRWQQQHERLLPFPNYQHDPYAIH